MANPDYKFEDLTKNELLAVAEQFGSDQVKASMSKDTIIKELTGDGVTFEMYKALLSPPEDQPVEFAELDDTPLDDPAIAPVVPEEEDEVDFHVVKMTRKNHTYQVRGYTFTQAHPYALVKEEDADFLVEIVGGFRMASPREIKEFYGAD